MAPSLTPDAEASLQAHFCEAISGEKPQLPGAILHVIDAENNAVLTHVAGSSRHLSSHTLTILHSISKIVGTIAYIQLVDRGLTSLDDSSIITTFLPELANKQVLTGLSTDSNGVKTPTFTDKKGEITPRILMNHTYGGGHTYFNPLLHEYLKDSWDTRNEVADPYQTLPDSPLLWQPGTHANYGQGFDWLAVLIERITKRNLATYLQENIFDPLGLKHIGYEEQYGGDITSRAGHEDLFWPRNFKQADGTFIALDPPILSTVDRGEGKMPYPKGNYHAYPLSTGLVSDAADLARLLLILAPQNNGRDPVSGHRLLSPESVEEITSPQLPPHLRNDSRALESAVEGIICPVDLFSEHLDPEGSWGLGCGVQGADRVLPGGRKGRSKGSVYWYGAANTEFWIDGEKGLVVVVNGNYFPWCDPVWTDFVAKIEGDIYEGLTA